MTHQSMETSKHDMETKGDSLKRGTQWLGRALTLNANMEGKMKGIIRMKGIIEIYDRNIF